MTDNNKNQYEQPYVPYRRAIAELSTHALQNNLAVMQAKSPNSQVIAMVKANGYGHGIRSVSKRLEGRVFAFGVASIDEAVALREYGVTGKIILMEGVICADDLDLVSALRLDLVVHDFCHLDWILHKNTQLSDIWVKVDIGMGRLGYFPDMLSRVFSLIDSAAHLIEGEVRLMGHLSEADILGSDENNRQVDTFARIVSTYQLEASLCNSAAIVNLPEHHYEFVRPGLALYGASPIMNQSEEQLALQPVMTVKSRLIAIKHYSTGQGIGYGHDFVCSQPMRVGVVSFGYGDGYPRSVRSGMPVLVHGKECPLVGRVSMDMMTVDLSGCLDACIGSEVTLWGNDLPISSVEAASGINRYELFTGVQNRVKFIWSD